MDGSTTNGSGVSNGSGSANGVSKAEKFEDEKRRIVESCFSKKDPDGSCMMTPERTDTRDNLWYDADMFAFSSGRILHHAYTNP